MAISSLYSEVSPSTTLKPCPLSYQQFKQEISRSAPGQGRQYQKLRKQFLTGKINQKYDKHDAVVKPPRMDKRVYPSLQVLRRTRVLASNMRPTDDHQIASFVQGPGGLDDEWKMYFLHKANASKQKTR